MKPLDVKTKKEAVKIGLKSDQERTARQDIRKMRGKVDFWPGYRKELYGH